MYYIVYIIIITGVFIELQKKRINKKFFDLIYLTLTLMVSFRYGQGSDFFTYKELYERFEDTSSWVLLLTYPDVGFAAICYFCNHLHIPFSLFYPAFALMTMGLFYFFFRRFCSRSMISLFLFYSVIFLVYPYSIIRQGFAYALFLAILFPYLIECKYIKYYIGLLLISTIHSSVLVTIFFPLIYKLNISQRTQLFIFFILIFCLIFNINLSSLSFLDRLSYYSDPSTSNMIYAKIVRCLIVFPIFIIPHGWLKEDTLLLRINKLLLYGFAVYVLISFSELAASRLWGYFLAFECILLFCIYQKKTHFKLKYLLLTYYIIISIILWFKDINGFIDQGEYEHCTILSYPYISIFDDPNTIYKYRNYYGVSYDSIMK